MIRITVDRDGLDRGTATRPLRTYNSMTGRTRHFAELWPEGDVRIIYSPDAPLQDGARVWIECDSARGHLDIDDNFWESA